MDGPDVERTELETALRHLARINRWTGARRALLKHLPTVVPPAGSRILDVGTGGADLPLAVAGWAESRGRRVSIVAVDRHQATLELARQRVAHRPEIRTLRADVLRLPFPAGAFDLALLSMTLHHLDGHALTHALGELARVAEGGRVMVGELERSVPNYLGARLLAATIWRGNGVTRHDGPISVRRAFTPGELLELARQAGLRAPQVHRHPFYRLILIASA